MSDCGGETVAKQLQKAPASNVSVQRGYPSHSRLLSRQFDFSPTNSTRDIHLDTSIHELGLFIYQEIFRPSLA
ncbi:Acetylornithine aminotransferase [Fusarium oxysporum f. sp. albedinis]|nr:Acetylornithine aminotransferase [Fusarium oxysporum f. sp. albedinis]